MNAYDVLKDHHRVLRGLCATISAAPAGSAERRSALDELLVELDIHMRIEDDLYYPAMAAATHLIAVAHAEHRQVFDQLATLLGTSPTAAQYEDEWHAFVSVLDAHATEEERDLVPPPTPVDLTDDELDALGRDMAATIDKLRNSSRHRLHVRTRARLLRAL
ncbi:hemerythrin domain-containing protein [Mycobacterium sp. pUA109]|uniref:hemerythrin domain-containing protein n=1 Tax=Mycobacterium sp. pUA109 TaxID=3238982 RepID=UPI00351B1606